MSQCESWAWTPTSGRGSGSKGSFSSSGITAQTPYQVLKCILKHSLMFQFHLAFVHTGVCPHARQSGEGALGLQVGLGPAVSDLGYRPQVVSLLDAVCHQACDGGHITTHLLRHQCHPHESKHQF